MSELRGTWVDNVYGWPNSDRLRFRAECSCGHVFVGDMKRLSELATIHDDSPNNKHVLRVTKKWIPE